MQYHGLLLPPKQLRLLEDLEDLHVGLKNFHIMDLNMFTLNSNNFVLWNVFVLVIAIVKGNNWKSDLDLLK
jgi:hypothetical protein